MSYVAISSVSVPHHDLLPFERLVVRLSTRFSTLEADEMATLIACSLEEVGAAFGVDQCTLIEYGEPGAATVAGSWAAAPYEPCNLDDLAQMPWLLQRVARNAVVATTAATDFPHAAAKDRAHADRTGLTARLAVPVALGARVSHGLLLARGRHADWTPPVIERLRLIGEIVGGGLDRLRHDAELQTIRTQPIASTEGGEEPPPHEESHHGSAAEAIIGASATFRLALARLAQVAPLDATVLLLGETGTGKELFARAVHDRSRRRGRTLIRVNCAALPATLIESELFGHERGAFTGAFTARQGRFELADGGTIFLDEIGDLAPELQAKLLRVLQEGEFERVGSSRVRHVDVRIIAATHIDLERAVAEGRFRADLYYRLNVFPVTLPPLRERRDDIPGLVWFFIHRHQRGLNRTITTVPPAVMRTLQRHAWPGNVRELENVVERGMIRSLDGVLQLDDAPVVDMPPQRQVADGDTLDAMQRLHIEKVLRECGGRINGAGNAAVRLGLHPNTLRFRIKKLGVALPPRRTPPPNPPSAGRPG